MNRITGTGRRLCDRMYVLNVIVTIASIFITIFIRGAIPADCAIVLQCAYLCCLLLMRTRKNVFGELSGIIISIIAVLRYDVYPITIMLDLGNANTFTIDVLWLVVYEMVGIYAIMYLFSNRLQRASKEEPTTRNANIGIITFCCTIGILPIVITNPQMLLRFSLSQQTIKRGVATSGSGVLDVVFSIGIWSLLISIIYMLRSISKFNSLQRFGAILLTIAICVFYILTEAISESNVRRWQILVTGLSLTAVLLNVFPEKRKFLIGIGMLGIGLGLIGATLVKFKDYFSFSTFFERYFSAKSLDAYFAGTTGITNGLRMVKSTPQSSSLVSMLTDFFSGIPIISRFFNAKVDSTAAMYLNYVHRTDLICPLVVQSIAHFGVLGTPIIAMIMTALSMNFNINLKKSNTLFSYMIYIELTAYFSLFSALNTTIVFGTLWTRLIYLMVLRMEKNYRVKGRKER